MKIERFINTDTKRIKRKRGRQPGVSGKKYFKTKLFVNEYLVDFKIYKAFIRCGYGTGQENTDRMQSSLYFNKPEVQQAIQEEVNRRCKELEITEQSVLKELSKIAFSDIKNYMTWDSEGNVWFKPSDALADNLSGAIAEFETKEQTRYVTVVDQDAEGKPIVDKNGKITTKRMAITVPSYKFKLYDKKSALIDLGKHLGLFWDDSNKAGDPLEFAKKAQQALREIETATNPS